MAICSRDSEDELYSFLEKKVQTIFFTRASTSTSRHYLLFVEIPWAIKTLLASKYPKPMRSAKIARGAVANFDV